jgi:hypothetical protein
MTKPALISQAGGQALQFAEFTGPAAPFVLAAGALLTVFGLIFGRHKKAIGRENSVLCAAVPAFNDAIQVIDQAVRSGQVTPQHGIEALGNLLSDFASSVAPIIKSCNAGCQIKREADAIILKKKASTKISPPSNREPAQPQRQEQRLFPSRQGLRVFLERLLSPRARTGFPWRWAPQLCFGC